MLGSSDQNSLISGTNSYSPPSRMDIKDILGISRDAAPAPMTRAPKHTVKKPEGMSRELFALLQQDATTTSATFVPTPAPETFKEKYSRVIGWEWRSFKNVARRDSLSLSHWANNNDKSALYSFARFNKNIKVLTYTDAEYEQHLVHLHQIWSKSETDTLFDLCRRFDMRWPIIHDRFPGNSK